jgi:hypothetical protein
VGDILRAEAQSSEGRQGRDRRNGSEYGDPDSVAEAVDDRVAGPGKGSILTAAGPDARAAVLRPLQRKVGNKATGTYLGRRRLVLQRDNEAAFGKWWGSIPGAEGSLKQWEANPVNQAKDRGGRTNWGVTEATYKARAAGAGLDPSTAAFEAMTKDQAKLIGKQFWRESLAAEINNDGVAVVVADWYWGAPNRSLRDALKAVLADFLETLPPPEEIDGQIVPLLNSIKEPNKVVVALTEKRLDFHREVVRKSPGQGVFLHGWMGRALERAWSTVGPEAVADILERRLAPADIEQFIARRLKPREIADLHDAARKANAAGVADLTAYRARVFRYEEAVRNGKWDEAAFFLNGFKKSDIDRMLTWAIVQTKSRKVVDQLHAAAKGSVGEGSQLATMTAPKQKAKK